MRTKKIIANIAAGFFPSREKRARVRRAIMDYTNPISKRRIKRKLWKKYYAAKNDWAATNKQTNNAILRPGRFDKYDLVFAIGAACPVSTILQAHNLRLMSSPIDWTDGELPVNWEETNIWRDTRFLEKINAIATKFHDFFNYEDFIVRRTYVADHYLHQDMLNTRTRIRFSHLFPNNTSWELFFPTAKQIINRRSERLLRAIDQSDRILICWAHRLGDQRNLMDAPVSDADVIQGAEIMKKIYPGKEIDFVFFEHDGTKDKFEYEKICVCDGAYRIRSNHFILETGYMAKYNYWDKRHRPILCIAEALDNISLTDKLKTLGMDES